MMATERILEMLAHHDTFLIIELNENVSDILHVLFSVCLLSSVLDIRNLFLQRMKEHELLNVRFDELQRFHKLSIDRELRMKELYEENVRLREQVQRGAYD